MNNSYRQPLQGDLHLSDTGEPADGDSSLGNRTAGLCEQVQIQAEMFLTLGIVSLLENILVISAVVKNKNLHSPMYYFLCSLAAADMLVNVSNSLETVVITALNSHILVVGDRFIQLSNFFDSMILLWVFVCSWAPFFLHLILLVACPKNTNCTCYMSHFTTYLVLIMCNSVIDPIIYAFHSWEMRKTIKEILCCFSSGCSLHCKY